MECAEVLELLSQYADGVCDPETASRVEAHLAGCGECASAIESLRACMQTLSSLSRVPAPPDFLDRVHERIEEPSILRRLVEKLFFPVRIKLPLELVGVTAAAVLVLLIHQNLQIRLL